MPSDAEESAFAWICEERWPGGPPRCTKCGSEAQRVSYPPGPLRCSSAGCHHYFSPKAGTFMYRTRLTYAEWRLVLDRVKGRLPLADACWLAEETRLSVPKCRGALDRLRAAVREGMWLPSGYQADALVGGSDVLALLRRE